MYMYSFHQNVLFSSLVCKGSINPEILLLSLGFTLEMWYNIKWAMPCSSLTLHTHFTHIPYTLHTHTLHTEISRKRYTSCTSFKNCSTDRRTWIHQFKQSVYVLSLVKLFVYVLYSRLVKNMTLHLHIFSFIRWDVLPPTCFNWLSVFYY